MDRKIQYIDVNSPRLEYGLNTNPIKIWAECFVDIEKVILKCIEKVKQKTKIKPKTKTKAKQAMLAMANLQIRNNVERISLPDFKLKYSREFSRGKAGWIYGTA